MNKYAEYVEEKLTFSSNALHIRVNCAVVMPTGRSIGGPSNENKSYFEIHGKLQSNFHFFHLPASSPVSDISLACIVWIPFLSESKESSTSMLMNERVLGCNI